MERWLVTGANGFLGSRLMKFYQEKYEITGAHHGNLDITDEAAAAEFVRAAAPQLVIHCAAISNTGTCQENPGLSEAVNVNGRQRRRLWPYFRTQCASDCRGCMISPGGG